MQWYVHFYEVYSFQIFHRKHLKKTKTPDPIHKVKYRKLADLLIHDMFVCVAYAHAHTTTLMGPGHIKFPVVCRMGNFISFQLTSKYIHIGMCVDDDEVFQSIYRNNWQEFVWWTKQMPSICMTCQGGFLFCFANSLYMRMVQFDNNNMLIKASEKKI